jgi:iron complex outermembrane receptor protein
VNRGGQSAYDLSLRGFKTTSNDRNALMTDGLPGQVSRFASPPTISVDHIEVVKGPASVLYGQAQPGGFVNIILKKPQEDRDFVVDLKAAGYRGNKLSFSDAPGYSMAADLTGPIDDAHKFLYRVVMENSDKDGWRDFTYDKSQYVAPSFRWNLSSATSLTVLTEYRYRKGAQDLFLPVPNRDISLIPRITNRLQEPGDYVKEEGYAGTVFFEHTFAKDVAFRFNARAVRNHDYTKWYDTVAMLSDLTTLQRRARIGDNHRKSYYFESTFSMPFETGFVKHKALAGVTGGYDDLDANRIQFVNGATTGALAKPGPGSLNINIYDPIYGLAPLHSSLPAGTFQHRITASKPIGAFLTDFITFTEQWKGSVGVRYAREKQTFEELTSSVAVLPSRSSTPSDVYPMAGLLFQPNRELTFYGSYATSFVPISPNMQNASGVFSFDPEKGKQFEIGAKAELMRGKAYMTLALFDIKRRTRWRWSRATPASPAPACNRSARRPPVARSSRWTCGSSRTGRSSWATPMWTRRSTSRMPRRQLRWSARNSRMRRRRRRMCGRATTSRAARSRDWGSAWAFPTSATKPETWRQPPARRSCGCLRTLSRTWSSTTAISSTTSR